MEIRTKLTKEVETTYLLRQCKHAVVMVLFVFGCKAFQS